MDSLQLICDFVNTADLEEGDDKLAEARGLQYWLVFHGLTELRARATERDAAAARALREALRELLAANNGIAVDRNRASAKLSAIAQAVGLVVRFEGGALRLVPTGEGAAAGIGRVLAAVGAAMGDGSWQQLKVCRSETCRWAFLDRSRNRSRQWCDMAVCGNRAKARAFRERHA
jgi:predicted RNA-binding Zn ribbon-like protein